MEPTTLFTVDEIPGHSGIRLEFDINLKTGATAIRFRALTSTKPHWWSRRRDIEHPWTHWMPLAPPHELRWAELPKLAA